MSSETWKIEKDLCRCCHSEGSFKNLAEPSETTDFFEIYADMLNECFSIDMAPVPGLLSAATYTICEVCVIRLRDAADFKKQVLTCEERFKDLYNRNGIKVAAPPADIEVKQETPDSEPEDDLKVEFSQKDNAQDDDDFSIDSLSDIKISEDENETSAKVKVVKKRKLNAKKTVKCKTSKKTKKKVKDEAGEEDKEAEKKKQGRVGKPKIFINKDEDYKNVGDKYQCARCDRSYKSLNALRYHVKTTHYKIPKYKCVICIDEFMTLPPLTVHKLEVHNIDDRVKCSVCNRMFNTSLQLKLHTKNYHMLGEIGKRYKCEICEFETFNRVNFTRHIVVHSTVKDYHCRFCKKSFLRQNTLKMHERIHTGVRRNVCNECGQAFIQKSSLNYHRRKYHPEVNF